MLTKLLYATRDKIPLTILSAILATIGALSLSVSMSLAKQLDSNIPTTLVVFIRSCFGLLFFLPFLIKQRKSLTEINNIPLHLIRVLLGGCAMLCTYYAYRNLPIAFATSIGMSNPIFVTVLSSIILKEKIGYKKWMLIICGYIGVLTIIEPSNFVIDIGTISALLANLLAASCTIIIKILSKTNSSTTIMFYGNIGITTIFCIVSSSEWQILEHNSVLIISFMGILGLITQICTILSLKYSTPSLVAPFEYTRILFALLIGFFVFYETPDISTIVGTIIVLSSTYTLVVTENPKSKSVK